MPHCHRLAVPAPRLIFLEIAGIIRQCALRSVHRQAWGRGNPFWWRHQCCRNPHSPTVVGEASAYVQGESLKAGAVFHQKAFQLPDHGHGGLIMNRPLFAAPAALVAGLITPASAQTQTRTMSFEACLETIRKVASDLGVAPINIVETDIARIVRFPTSDGSVVVTCS